jgi:hypothetical protein
MNENNMFRAAVAIFRFSQNAINQTLPQNFMQPQDDNPYLHITDGKDLIIDYI